VKVLHEISFRRLGIERAANLVFHGGIVKARERQSAVPRRAAEPLLCISTLDCKKAVNIKDGMESKRSICAPVHVAARWNQPGDVFMRRLAKAIFILALGMTAALAEDERRDKPATPSERYQALLKEQQNGPEELSKAKTDEERKQVQSRLGKLPLRFLELAEENPKDPVALEALIQTVSLANSTIFPAGGEDSPGERALAQLLRDHVQSDKLGALCQQILFGFHKSRETFLRAVLKANPHPEVRGLACLSLAQHLNDRLNRLEVLRSQDRPDLAERYHRVFGKGYIEELERQDRAAAIGEIEALFERAAEKYAGVVIPVSYYGSGGTVGEKAGAELFQIRRLAVGKEAPEIEGEDQDGKRFKLSDYRDKVVLLDFWNHR
jgi:hypothetical protein